MENAATHSDEAGFVGQERRAALFGELHLKLLEQYAPPSIVVNEAHDVVHLSDKAGRYLRFAAGEPSMNLFRIINPGLQIELRSALFRASQGQEANVTSAPQTVHLDGRNEVITLQVRRIASAPAEKYYLVLFEVRLDLAPKSVEPAAEGDVTRGLDDEIEYLKQQPSATVEQYASSNEELKASNEELQAMNEELRSATEELETNNEELQSVNEVLSTVNSELKSSVEDLSSANSDLNNLMASTDIGTVFLDRQLRIVRFTPSAQMVFNLLPADLGRPLAAITHRLHYDGLIPDAMQVLDRLVTIEREVPLDDAKRWFLVRIAPYRTAEDRISGVVATFIDVTVRRRAEEDLRALSEQAERQLQNFNTVMSAVPDFIYEFNLDGRFTFINQSLLKLWQKTFDEAVGRNFHELDYPTDLATRLQQQIQEVIETQKTLKDETPYTSAFGSRMYEYIFFPLRAVDGRVEGVGGVTRDITERRQAEEALRASEERFRNVADNVPQMIWTNDAKGAADYFNGRWYEYSGLTYDESVGLGWQAIVHPDDEPASSARWHEALSKGEVFDAEYRLRRRDGSYRWFIGRNVPLRANGKVLSWFGTATDIDDLKQAQAKTGEIEERFRLLVEGTPDYAMFLLDPDNQITYWSSGAERVFGWSREEAVGQTGALLFVPEDEAKGALEKEMGIALEQGYAPDRRWHLRRDGTRLWIDGIMRRIDHSDGTLRGFAKIGRDATDLHRAEEKLREAHDQLEQRVRDRTRELEAMNETLEQEMAQRQMLERQILKVTERERARISQDLHDSLCQDLTATAFLLKSRAKATAMLNEEAAVALREAAEMVNANVGLARDLARGLHPFELGTGGLVSALRELATRTNDNVTCRCECPRSLRVPNEEVALNLYRIAQEAVLNAVKHAKASDIAICIEREANEIILVVADNGTARRPSKHKRGMGIYLMQYRANVSGGSLQIERERGGGTKVKCRVPAKQ